MKVLQLLTITAALALPVAQAHSTNPAGTTGSGTPLVEDKANPSNRDPATDWGWLGLAGLLGLGGLAGRKYVETHTVTHTTGATTTGTVGSDVKRN